MIYHSNADTGFTIEGEYIFSDYAEAPASFVSSETNIWATVPDLVYPDHALGSGGTANRPELTPVGLHITHDKYLNFDSYLDFHDYGANRMFPLWLYYVDGVMGEIINIDFSFN